ncbi:MAG: HAMP domain-containing sensor histidine kinase [Actinomycetota bacterium]|nr:HAMP domain-containing sensor histidine kinase [Actinomycetota bacterium]
MRLRTRLYAGLGAIAVAFAISGYLVATTQQRYLTQQLDRDLQSSMPAALSLLGDNPAPLPPGQGAALSKLYVGHLAPDGLLTTIVPGPTSGSPAVSPQDAMSHMRRGAPPPFTVAGVGTDERFRVMIATRPGRTGWEVVALSLESTDAAYQRLLIATGVGGLAVLAVIALIAGWVVRLGVKPINEMTAAADAITAGEKGRRMAAYPGGTEAGHLARAFNTMLDERDVADHRLRQFVADASHELRTPLTSIRGYADLYQAGGLHDPSRLDDAMRRVSGEAERMTSIVNDLLLLTNLDRGMKMQLAAIDAAEVLHDVVADARVVQPERSITLVAHPSLPCSADRQRLHQVVAAVVHNALVHTPPGTPIEVVGRREASGVAIEVTDHGPGMTPEVAAHAFERFYRGEQSRSRHTGGSGMGLAIAQSNVEAHGGRIVVHTQAGRGCRFVIALPAPATTDPDTNDPATNDPATNDPATDAAVSPSSG